MSSKIKSFEDAANAAKMALAAAESIITDRNASEEEKQEAEESIPDLQQDVIDTEAALIKASRPAAKIAKAPVELSPKDLALKKLKDTLTALNGLEVYSPESTPDGILPREKMMRIPASLYDIVCNTNSQTVGLGMSSDNVADYAIRIAAVNYRALRLANHPKAAMVSAIRANIITKTLWLEGTDKDDGVMRRGRFTKRNEIILVEDDDELEIGPNGAVAGVGEYFKELLDFITLTDTEELAAMVRLLPVFASIEFQKTNHHYVDNDVYREAYRRHFRSAQLLEIESKYNAPNVVYDSVHWMGPWNMEAWKNNLMESSASLLPRGIKMKMTPPPAGSALITTQIAVWNAILVYPGTEDLKVRYEEPLRKMRNAADQISKSRLEYHVFSRLYGLEGKLNDSNLKDAMEAAASLAGIAQGFLDSVAAESDLGKAKALKKHADQNIALYNIAKAAFQGAQVRLRRDARTRPIAEVIAQVVSRPVTTIVPRPTQVEEIE